MMIAFELHSSPQPLSPLQAQTTPAATNKMIEIIISPNLALSSMILLLSFLYFKDPTLTLNYLTTSLASTAILLRSLPGGQQLINTTIFSSFVKPSSEISSPLSKNTFRLTTYAYFLLLK